MKTCCYVLIALPLLSCTHNQRSGDPFPDYPLVEEDLIPYEGILPSFDGRPAQAELYLRPGAPGLDGQYKFYETIDLPRASSGSTSRGEYTVLMVPGGQRIIHVKNCTLVHPPVGIERLPLPERTTADLYFRTKDGNELVLVDDDFAQTVPRYTLIRRSDLFTAEGYVTIYTDSTAEFFERNTRKEWPLARYGHYRDVVRKYHSSAKEKFEGIYLKALSYTVSCRRDNGEQFDAVVFKRILDMDTVRAVQ